MKARDLTESMIRDFAGSTIYARGQAYFRDDMVQDLDYDQETDSIRAEVAGSSGADYEVEIQFGVREMDASCDCPYDGYPCKHIVATLLAFLKNREKLFLSGRDEKKGAASLRKGIEGLSKDELVQMVMACAGKYPDFKRELMIRFQPDEKITLSTILKQIDKSFPSIQSRSYAPARIAKELNALLKSTEDASDAIKIEVTWRIADRILQELNEYGMSEESLENTLVDALDILEECFTDSASRAEERTQIIASLMDYYLWGNSGMVDSIYETVMNLCTAKSDYQIVIDKLEAQPSTSYSKQYLLPNLYAQIGDESAQLRTLEGHLEYGMDYWRLARFWLKKGNEAKAMEIVQSGIRDGKGRKNELYEYLEQHYLKQNDFAKILQLLEEKIERKDLHHGDLTGDSAYRIMKQHYDSQGDYDGQAKLLDLRWNSGKIDLALYTEAEKTLKEKEWRPFEEKLLSQLKKEVSGRKASWEWGPNPKAENLAAIYDHKNDLDSLFLLAKQHLDLLVKYQKKLSALHPLAYVGIYSTEVNRLIEQRGRANYQAAVGYIRSIREIYQTLLKQPEEWRRYLAKLKSDHSKLRAFQEELNKI
jgi:uncharacterized Zn finger protein